MNAVDSLFKKWKLEGKLEGKHESIITMWKKGHKAEFIADCLDIPLNEVKEVIEKFEKRANN